MEKEKSRIDHWIYEVKVPEEIKIALDEIEAKHGPLGDQFFEFMIYMNSHPEEYWRLVHEIPDDGRIEFLLEYSVYEGETESEARMRAIENTNNNGDS